MLLALSMVPSYSLHQDIQNEVQHDCWLCDATGIDKCHMMPKVSSMEPLQSLGQGNQIEMQHDFLVLQCLCH